MKNTEREEIRTAIRELMDDECQFEIAVGRLCRLVGWRYPASEICGRAVTTRELMAEWDRCVALGEEAT